MTEVSTGNAIATCLDHNRFGELRVLGHCDDGRRRGSRERDGRSTIRGLSHHTQATVAGRNSLDLDVSGRRDLDVDCARGGALFGAIVEKTSQPRKWREAPLLLAARRNGKI